jgi:hypothetical protein
MTTWLEAHRLANVAAAQAHHDLHVDTSHWRIDVTAAIARANVLLLWRPLPRLFGAYINEPGDRPGMLVNSQLSFAVGRHTAAHELGHHRFRHPTRYDGDLAVTDADDVRDGPVVLGAQSTRHNWPNVEKVAEAFAAWFLMPRQSVLAGLRLLGIARPRDEVDVYSLSVLLGVPYRSLVRHLINIRLASSAQVRAWGVIPPPRIKTRLDRHVVAPASRRGSVWLVTPDWDGALMPVNIADRIVMPPGHVLSSPLPQWLDLVPSRDSAPLASLVLEVATNPPMADAVLYLTSPSGFDWRLHVHFEAAPSGLDSHWRNERVSTV